MLNNVFMENKIYRKNEILYENIHLKELFDVLNSLWESILLKQLAAVFFEATENCFRHDKETRVSRRWKPPGGITSRWQLLPQRPSSAPTGATSSVSAVHTSFQPFNDGRGECNHRAQPLLWGKHAPSNDLWRQGTFPWGSELLPLIFEPRAR